MAYIGEDMTHSCEVMSSTDTHHLLYIRSNNMVLTKWVDKLTWKEDNETGPAVIYAKDGSERYYLDGAEMSKTMHYWIVLGRRTVRMLKHTKDRLLNYIRKN